MAQEWLFRGEGYLCDLRVAGVLVRDGKILVQRDHDGSEYALPGGHVRVGETTEGALLREYCEETGAEIVCQRLLWTEECFWEWNGTQTHNISFYYRIELAEGADIPDLGAFVPHRDNDAVVIGWMPIEQLSEVTVYPEFIHEAIKDLNAPPAHYVTRA